MTNSPFREVLISAVPAPAHPARPRFGSHYGTPM